MPRIEQIINNTIKIKTPIIMAKLEVEDSMDFAKEVVGKIEKTTLGEVCEYIEEVHQAAESFLVIKLDMNLIRHLKLKISADSIKYSIATTRNVKVSLSQISIASNSVRIFVYSMNCLQGRNGFWQSGQITEIVAKWQSGLSESMWNMCDDRL